MGIISLTNLITACTECNRGKGARQLDDSSVVHKQKQQLDELNEKRLQLEMMLEWKQGLLKLKESEVESIAEYWQKVTNYSLTESGKRILASWLKKYSVQQVLDAMEKSTVQYLRFDIGKAQYTIESVTESFEKIPRIIVADKIYQQKPWLQEIFYIRGILKNRLRYVNEWKARDLMERARELDASMESLKEFAKEVPNWTAWRQGMERFIQEQEDKQQY